MIQSICSGQILNVFNWNFTCVSTKLGWPQGALLPFQNMINDLSVPVKKLPGACVKVPFWKAKLVCCEPSDCVGWTCHTCHTVTRTQRKKSDFCFFCINASSYTGGNQSIFLERKFCVKSRERQASRQGPARSTVGHSNSWFGSSLTMNMIGTPFLPATV